ncbi:PREDICTED: putative F-box protein At2g19630 [Camelina sativa]|uniref:F-box protein At2g19630 n=1 Tax=Camelina sativa TaxID=90675 RepID=A0ABM0YXB6_CAMSA|nr:PREDICTED: putative F-box protein At2g19630 [Camelina sativa]
MGLTISRPNCDTPSFFSLIPNDLLIEIVTRLSVEDLARCRCVSKQWASVLRHRLTNSSTSPRLLFTFHLNGTWVFFSAPQPQSLDQNYSCLLTAEYHMCFPTRDCGSRGICPPVWGLICNRKRGFVICNPSTGEYKTLPNPTWIHAEMTTFFGFDPVGKQYKVLCVNVYKSPVFRYARVLTLGTGKLSWRKITCSRPYDPWWDVGICISGVLYYIAHERNRHRDCLIVCFVLSSEKFEFITPPPIEKLWCTKLINYKAKLGVFVTFLFTEKTESIELWVLDDAEEGRWSKHIYILPPIWKNLAAAEAMFHFVGMTRNGEIVLSSFIPSDPLYVLIYNVERHTFIKARIQGFGSRTGSGIYTFIDYIENLIHM